MAGCGRLGSRVGRTELAAAAGVARGDHRSRAAGGSLRHRTCALLSLGSLSANRGAQRKVA